MKTKNPIILLLVFLFSNLLNAQSDTIITKDGRKIACNIRDEEQTMVVFFLTAPDSAKIHTMAKRDIKKIKYLKVKESEVKKIPFLNISAGCGPAHGYLGLQTILGYNNTGLILGVGTTEYATPLAGTIGFQLAVKWFYVNAGYGTIGIEQTNNEPIVSIKGRYLNFGTMINLNKKKTFYLELAYGLVHYDPPRINPYYIYTYRYETFGATLALGYRIGKLY